jgi:hypothetical protein
MNAPKSKLLHLKPWFTVSEASNYLTTVFGEDVRSHDVLRFALDGHLKVSVRFVNDTYAVAGKVVPREDAEWFVSPSIDGEGEVEIANGTVLPDGKGVVVWSRDLRRISGVWDLPLVGAERLDVEHLFQRMTEGPDLEFININGTFVTGPDGIWLELVERFSDEMLAAMHSREAPRHDADNYFPAATLPSDSEIVVRTAALRAFEDKVGQAENGVDKPLEKRERTTLLIMIAALARLAKIDIAKPSKAATSIESVTALMGARVAARTIEGHLNRVAEVIEERTT